MTGLRRFRTIACMFLLCCLFSMPAMAVTTGSEAKVTSTGTYLYKSNGELITGKSVQIVKIGNTLYAADTNGKALTNQFFTIGTTLYCARKNGTLFTNVVVEDVTFKADGTAKQDTAYKLKLKTMQIAKSVAGSKTTKAAKLKAIWNYLTKKHRFRYGHASMTVNKKNKWYIKAAYNMLNRHSGDCRSFAAAFAVLAREIGYTATMQYGYALWPGKTKAYRHMWVIINGKYYDPERAARGVLGKKYKYGYAMKSYSLIKGQKKIGKYKISPRKH